ncbi:MAG: hypothetical protein ACLFPS_09535 [Clostridia bacterium]
MVGGIALGFAVSLVIPDIFIVQVGLIILLLALSVLQAKNYISPSTAAGVLIFSGIQLLLMKYNIAFADDGGNNSCT